MNLLNPYLLLGVTPKSSMRELTKAYHQFSLLVHPDKGGKKEDMIVIQQAYEYIKKQFLNCEKIKTYEELEEDFDLFCKHQTSKIPPYRKIWELTDEFQFHKEFNKQFEKNKQTIESNLDPFQNGYGNFMEQSEYNNNSKIDITQKFPINQKTSIQKVKQSFTTELIEYKEPLPLPDTYGEHIQFGVESIQDFSSQHDTLQTMDYMKALSDNPPLDKLIKLKSKKTLKQLIKERKQFDKSLSETKTI